MNLYNNQHRSTEEGRGGATTNEGKSGEKNKGELPASGEKQLKIKKEAGGSISEGGGREKKSGEQVFGRAIYAWQE